MAIRVHRTGAALAVIAVIACSALTFAQERPVGNRTQPAPQKAPAEAASRVEPDQVQPTWEETLPKAMADLTKQIDKLTVELRLLRNETQRNGTSLELILYEERLSKVESKLDDMNAVKNQLEARELEMQRRSQNIQTEMIMRGGQFLRRDQAEAAIRADIQRIVDETRAQKETTQQRITDLQTQADALRRRTEVLRKKIELLEAQAEVQNR
jgi:hypothetical protein